MEHFKTVVVPAIEKQIVEFVTCDLCGEKYDSRNGYDVDEVEISYKQGKSYPEGSCGTTTEIDICGKCFSEKLLPWLKSQGATPRERDFDY